MRFADLCIHQRNLFDLLKRIGQHAAIDDKSIYALVYYSVDGQIKIRLQRNINARVYKILCISRRI